MTQVQEQSSVKVAPAPRAERREAESKPLPPWAVVLHNDDLNTMEFVIETLQMVFRHDEQKAVTLMLAAHNTGRALVWSGAKEHAELKVEQVRSRGCDPVMRHAGAMPLRVTMEPLPA